MEPYEIADKAEELKTGYLAVSLAMPVVLDPRLHVLHIYERYYEQTGESPVEVLRHDGTLHSDESLKAILTRATKIPGAGLRGDALAFAAMHGSTVLGDMLIGAKLIRADEPLLQFARHLRNACAHGNRWHFLHGEPKTPASLRSRSLDPALHGAQAINGWVGPGDYLDDLDDLGALLRAL